jgi:thiol:disulfide interchange protein/DsbC/DsbD-like thiol-disulfide interchange protein
MDDKPLKATAYNVDMKSLIARASLILGILLTTLATPAQLTEVGDGGPGPAKAQHLTAELVTLAPRIAAGGQLQIGLSLTLEEHWHVYWVNPGDPGEAPSIKWTLPAGITAAPIQYPIPSRIPLGPLMNYGYENQVTFPVTLSAAAGTKPGKVHLDAHITWLVCASQCFPGKAHLGMDLDVVSGPLAAPPLVGALGSTLTTMMPKPLPAGMSATAIGDAKQILYTLTTGKKELHAQFYPFDQDQIANAADQPIDSIGDGVKILLQRAPDPNGPATGPPPAALPKELHGLVKLSDNEAYDITVPLTPGAIQWTAARTVAKPEAATDVTLFGALGLAFVGGILLNLMPCVFPVLFLKGLALVNASGEEKDKQRKHGLVYTLGILVSFWSIVGVLLALRAGGSQFGWGFQLQSPTFVAILAALIFFFALSLAGQFEIGLTLMNTGDSLARKQGYAGSFFTGVLATVVATPCTAPLMGAAIGFALAQSSLVAFGVFTALALGLAFPYLVLSWQPAWTAILPRPGAWMETLKQLTAVPLFVTVIILAWVYGSLYGADGTNREAWLLGCFLLLAIAGWALGKWPAKLGSTVAAVVLVAIGIALPLVKFKVVVERWQPYTTASLEAARASGHPVFVDFTANWCISCKYNEATVLDSPDIVSRFAASDVVLLRADWTAHDDFISGQLATLGRSGVPTYVIYPAGKTSNPDVLPELLTKGIVLNALEKDLKLGTP